jgi:hypothetical protein
MTPERISRSTRTAHGLAPYSFPPLAILLPSPRQAVCIIATSVEPREMARRRVPTQLPSILFLSKDKLLVKSYSSTSKEA